MGSAGFAPDPLGGILSLSRRRSSGGYAFLGNGDGTARDFDEVEQCDIQGERAPLMQDAEMGGESTSPRLRFQSWSAKDNKPRKRVVGNPYADANCTGYDKLFFQHKNAQFANSLKLAARGTVMLYLIGFPLILNLGDRDENDPWRVNFFHKNHFFNKGNIVIFIYTMQKTFGETVSNGCDAIFGTLMAHMSAWILFYIFPEGIDTEGQESLAQLVGIVFGPGFVFTLLFLNFRNLTQVFALANWVYHWMAFMEPGQEQAKTQWGAVLFGRYGVPLFAFESLMTAVGGVFFAIVATVLPYPLTAMEKARDSADLVVDAIEETWFTAEQYYTGDNPNPLVQVHLQLDLDDVHQDIRKLNEALDQAWWERTFYPRWQSVFLCLSQLDALTREVYDRIKDVVDSCLHEEFEELHIRFMKECKGSMHEAIGKTSGLLRRLCMLCKKGGIESQQEVDDLHALIVKVEEHRRDFTHSFVSFKKSQGLSGLSTALLDEHVFGLEVCAYVSLVCSLGKKLVQDWEDQRSTREGFLTCVMRMVNRPEIKQIFDWSKIREPTHLNSCVRNSVAILIGWSVGYHGYRKMILRYDAGIAGTAAVLICKFSGSAMVRNLERLQGVVVGLVAGMLVYSLLGYCAVWAYISLSVAFILYSGTALFTYYHSERYSYIGLLLAAFGTSQFLKGCSSKITDPRNTFYHVINVCVSIFIIGIVDAAVGLWAARPSTRAQEAFYQALKQEEMLVQQLMKPMTSLPGMDSSIQACIDKAQAMAEEAEEEPRYWRTPWKADLWKRGIKAVSVCRTQLHCYLCIMNTGPPAEESTSDYNHKSSRHSVLPPQRCETWYQAASELQTFDLLRQLVLDTMARSLTSSAVFISDDATAEERVEIETEGGKFEIDFARQMEVHIHRFIDEANAGILKDVDQKELEQLDSLEEVPSAQISILLSSFRVLHTTLNHFHFEILASF